MAAVAMLFDCSALKIRFDGSGRHAHATSRQRGMNHESADQKTSTAGGGYLLARGKRLDGAAGAASWLVTGQRLSCLWLVWRPVDHRVSAVAVTPVDFVAAPGCEVEMLRVIIRAHPPLIERAAQLLTAVATATATTNGNLVRRQPEVFERIVLVQPAGRNQPLFAEGAHRTQKEVIRAISTWTRNPIGERRGEWCWDSRRGGAPLIAAPQPSEGPPAAYSLPSLTETA